MSKLHLEIIENLTRTMLGATNQPIDGRWLHEQIRYQLVIAKKPPVHQQFEGPQQVLDYLTLVKFTYKVLQTTPPSVKDYGGGVVIRGSDIAQLLMTREVVAMDWIGVYEFEEDRLKNITMTIFRWATHSTSKPPQNRIAAQPERIVSSSPDPS